jgi:hypothetical protein
VLLACVLLAIVLSHPTGKLALALGIAIPIVLAWGFLTLHFPSSVAVDELGIAFHGYGRVHRFPWSEVRKVSVRRFVVRDRVMVRIVPSPPWRGRYWVLDAIDGFDALLRALESHGKLQ